MTGGEPSSAPCADGSFRGLLLEGFKSALQAHAARALEQDHVAFAKIFLQPDAGLAGAVDELRGDSLGARAFDDLRRKAAHTDDAVEAGHLFTCRAVKRSSFGAEF